MGVPWSKCSRLVVSKVVGARCGCHLRVGSTSCELEVQTGNALTRRTTEYLTLHIANLSEHRLVRRIHLFDADLWEGGHDVVYGPYGVLGIERRTSRTLRANHATDLWQQYINIFCALILDDCAIVLVSHPSP